MCFMQSREGRRDGGRCVFGPYLVLVLRQVITRLLIEGRVDDVKKFPHFTSALVKKLSDNDPSGNNKYLMGLKK